MLLYIVIGLFIFGSLLAILLTRRKTSPDWDDTFGSLAIFGAVLGVVFGLVLPLTTWNTTDRESYKIDDGTIHHMPGIQDESEYYFISNGDKYSLGGTNDEEINFSIGSANIATKRCATTPEWIAPYGIWTNCHWEVIAESSGN